MSRADFKRRLTEGIALFWVAVAVAFVCWFGPPAEVGYVALAGLVAWGFLVTVAILWPWLEPRNGDEDTPWWG